jgi:hypothetical protein
MDSLGDRSRLMPRRRSDGGSRSVRTGRVKAASRASGSANALALTRPDRTDTLKPKKSRLTGKTVASPSGRGYAPRLFKIERENPLAVGASGRGSLRSSGVRGCDLTEKASIRPRVPDSRPTSAAMTYDGECGASLLIPPPARARPSPIPPAFLRKTTGTSELRHCLAYRP